MNLYRVRMSDAAYIAELVALRAAIVARLTETGGLLPVELTTNGHTRIFTDPYATLASLRREIAAERRSGASRVRLARVRRASS